MALAAILLREIEEVLEARIVEGEVTVAKVEKILDLISKFSVAACSFSLHLLSSRY